jgi:hypothetical protein
MQKVRMKKYFLHLTCGNNYDELILLILCLVFNLFFTFFLFFPINHKFINLSNFIQFYKFYVGIICRKGKRKQMGENIVKITKCVKVKVFFQRLHMTCVIFVLVYNLKFYILDIHFNIACSKYK